jgi:hypothetical protein
MSVAVEALEDPTKLEGFSEPPNEEEVVQLSRYQQHIATRTRIAFDRAEESIDELINVISDLVCPHVKSDYNLKSMVAETLFKLHAAQSVIVDARATMPAKSEVFRAK